MKCEIKKFITLRKKVFCIAHYFVCQYQRVSLVFSSTRLFSLHFSRHTKTFIRFMSTKLNSKTHSKSVDGEKWIELIYHLAICKNVLVKVSSHLNFLLELANFAICNLLPSCKSRHRSQIPCKWRKKVKLRPLKQREV